MVGRTPYRGGVVVGRMNCKVAVASENAPPWLITEVVLPDSVPMAPAMTLTDSPACAAKLKLPSWQFRPQRLPPMFILTSVLPKPIFSTLTPPSWPMNIPEPKPPKLALPPMVTLYASTLPSMHISPQAAARSGASPKASTSAYNHFFMISS
jgi:hypothetical protein